MEQQKKPLRKRVDLHYKPGLRVYKTIFSVMLCMGISLLTDSVDAMPVMVVSAIVALRVSQQDTIRVGVYRVVGTLLGGLLGMLCVVLEPIIPFYTQGMFVLVIPLVMLFDFYLCNVFHLQDVSVISCIVVLLVSMHINAAATQALPYALHRVGNTLIGVLIATVVNIAFFPKRSKEEVEHHTPSESMPPEEENSEAK